MDDAAKLVLHIKMEDKNGEGAGSWRQSCARQTGGILGSTDLTD